MWELQISAASGAPTLKSEFLLNYKLTEHDDDKKTYKYYFDIIDYQVICLGYDVKKTDTFHSRRCTFWRPMWNRRKVANSVERVPSVI